VRNKANFGEPGWAGGKTVQNKPNFAEGTARGLGPIMQNKAKLGQDGTFGGWCVREEPIVQNKANWQQSDVRGKSFMGKELW
jgi:hypothetical protein